ncbi:MAG: uracil-DNA glycosylase family 4 [Polyangiales bacterium]|jgi:uracil-DNA glycosylase family 4
MDMDDGLDDLRADVADLGTSIRELLRWESELSGTGIPDIPGISGLSDRQLPENAAPAPLTAAKDPVTAAKDPAHHLRLLSEDAAKCTACALHAGRTKSVFGRGNAQAELLFVGEGPNVNEDEQGVPFIGRAGELLDRMIAAMGFGPEEIYICNVVKCRPPENRTPQVEEAQACSSFLTQQIDVIQPKVIVALGRCAAENLGLATPGEDGWRGRWGEVRGIPSLSTYHPAYLLRSPEQKKPVWSDLKQVVARLGRSLPRR